MAHSMAPCTLAVPRFQKDEDRMRAAPGVQQILAACHAGQYDTVLTTLTGIRHGGPLHHPECARVLVLAFRGVHGGGRPQALQNAHYWCANLCTRPASQVRDAWVLAAALILGTPPAQPARFRAPRPRTYCDAQHLASAVACCVKWLWAGRCRRP